MLGAGQSRLFHTRVFLSCWRRAVAAGELRSESSAAFVFDRVPGSGQLLCLAWDLLTPEAARALRRVSADKETALTTANLGPLHRVFTMGEGFVWAHLVGPGVAGAAALAVGPATGLVDCAPSASAFAKPARWLASAKVIKFKAYPPESLEALLRGTGVRLEAPGSAEEG